MNIDMEIERMNEVALSMPKKTKLDYIVSTVSKLKKRIDKRNSLKESLYINYRIFSIGRAIRKVREEKELSTIDLSIALGLKIEQLRSIENDVLKLNMNTLSKVSSELGVETSKLLEIAKLIKEVG